MYKPWRHSMRAGQAMSSCNVILPCHCALFLKSHIIMQCHSAMSLWSIPSNLRQLYRKGRDFLKWHFVRNRIMTHFFHVMPETCFLISNCGWIGRVTYFHSIHFNSASLPAPAFLIYFETLNKLQSFFPPLLQG